LMRVTLRLRRCPIIAPFGFRSRLIMISAGGGAIPVSLFLVAGRIAIRRLNHDLAHCRYRKQRSRKSDRICHSHESALLAVVWFRTTPREWIGFHRHLPVRTQ
jgi:hypothetical protein